MAANLPELTYRFPTLLNGVQNSLKPSIIFDWNTDMETTQFSDNAKRAENIILMDDTNSTILPTSFISYTALSRRVELQPTNNLESDKTYRVLIKSKLVSSDGRKSMNEYLWTFMTASGSIAEITPLGPGNFTVQAIAPVINWTPVTYIGSAGSALTVTYRLQIAERFDFSTVDYTTDTTSTSAYPVYPGFITDDTTYYWRVLPMTVEATGGWSDVWQFFYGRLIDSDPTNRQYLPEGDLFGVKNLGFTHMSSNLAAYPAHLSFTFTSTPASDYANYIEVWRRSVLPRNDKVSTYQDFLVNGTWTSGGNTLTFVPSETVANNTRYEFKFYSAMVNTVGFELGEDYSFWFTSTYTPFYVSPRVIRARFLSAEQKVPDDLINFYIHQASLEANARYWGTSIISPTVGDYLIESLVRDSPNLLSFGVLKWTEAAASYKILKAILFESLRDIGRSEKLGDSQVSLTKDFMDGINAAIDLTKEELTQWENYLTPSHMPVTVPKSMGWNPRNWDHDWSIMGLESHRDDGFGHESSNDFSKGYGPGFGRGYW